MYISVFPFPPNRNVNFVCGSSLTRKLLYLMQSDSILINNCALDIVHIFKFLGKELFGRYFITLVIALVQVVICKINALSRVESKILLSDIKFTLYPLEMFRPGQIESFCRL